MMFFIFETIKHFLVLVPIVGKFIEILITMTVIIEVNLK